MIKKTLFVAAGAVLVLGLLFGRNMIPYASTAISKAQSWADSQVDTSFKIDTARGLLENVKDQIEPMVYSIAKQEVEIKRLSEQVEQQDEALVKAHLHIMQLRDHLNSGDTSYVSTNGRSYSNNQVREDLSRKFRQYKAAEERLTALRITLEARQAGLEAARANLEETIAKRRDLQLEIENLEAEMKMLDVARTASQFAEFDSSDLARTQQMIDEIRQDLETEAVMLSIAPQLTGEIPMDEGFENEDDIVDAIDVYFGTSGDSVVRN